MKAKRWITETKRAAAAGTPRLPFERGAPRAAMIARRQARARAGAEQDRGPRAARVFLQA